MRPLPCVLLTAGAFAGGVALGFALAPRQSAPAAIAAEPTALAKKSDQPAVATPPARRSPALAGENGSPAQPTTAIAPAPSSWKVLSDLIARKIIPTGAVRLVGLDGKLTPQALELFNVDPSDAPALQRCLDDVADQVAALEKRNATVAPGPDGTIAITVQPFEQDGAAVYQDLTNRLDQILGKDRSASFVGMGGDELERMFKRFGAQEGRMAISYTANAAGGEYTLTERHMIGPGQFSETRGQYQKPDDLLARLGPHADAVKALLPSLTAQPPAAGH